MPEKITAVAPDYQVATYGAVTVGILRLNRNAVLLLLKLDIEGVGDLRAHKELNGDTPDDLDMLFLSPRPPAAEAALKAAAHAFYYHVLDSYDQGRQGWIQAEAPEVITGRPDGSVTWEGGADA